MRSETHFVDIMDLRSGEFVRVDYRAVIERGKVVDFAINVSLINDELEWEEDIYRVDTKHGFLHEQRFWLSPKPIRLEEDYTTAFANKKRNILKRCASWVKLVKESKTR